jgi:hypothetical protein
MTYYCCVCREPLHPGRRSNFHSDCLKADKRRRIREERQRERETFVRWLRRQKRPRCGADFGAATPSSLRPKAELRCEASHGITVARGKPELA